MSAWPNFEELPPLDADELGVWLSMTGWSTKARVVGLIGSRVGGDWWTAEQVAKPLGLTTAYTSRLLAHLERDLVLWRDGGAGGRLFWVEVNPRVEQWRGVDWTVSRFERQMVLAHWRESVMSTAPGRLFARSCSARRASAIARCSSARRDPGAGTTSRDPASREQGGGPGGGSRALRSARRGGTVHDLQDRRAFSPGAPGSSVPGVDDENSYLSGPASQPEVDSIVVDRVCAEVLRRARPGPGGRRFMSEAKRSDIVQLIARYGGGVTLEAVRRVTAEGQQVPNFLRDLGLVLALGAEEADALQEPVVDVEAERLRLMTLRERQQALLPTYVELGEDDRADSCRSTIAACETDLAALQAPQEEAL